jgi:NADPH-ferrihemoprotein reductase
MESFNSLLTLFQAHSSLYSLSGSQPPLLHNLKPSSAPDSVAALLFLLTSIGYFTRGTYWDKPDPYYHVYFKRPQVTEEISANSANSGRDIAQRLTDGAHQCVIFWGSQSGTAERFAEALGRECSIHFGINALVADLSDYDAESIANIQNTHFVIFLVSTYGEGDPSDNTADLWNWIKRLNDESVMLKNLRYLAFGLGNSNYKYYNRVLDVVTDALDAAGAHALIERQRADDANGGTEEDFQSWKDDVFAMFRGMGYEQKTIVYQPTMQIDFADGSHESLESTSSSTTHQSSTINSAITPLVVKTARELFSAGDRNCIHMELDLGDSDLRYKTGDHIGIWPCNPDEEIDRLITVLGLDTQRDDTFTVTNQLEGAKSKIPSPTTLDTAFRHHLEISGPVARKTVLGLAQFAPTPEAKATLLELGQSRDKYEQWVALQHMTLGRLLQFAGCAGTWNDLPLSFVFENLLTLQPRYYSISSSSVISPRKIAITALVVNKELPGDSAVTIPGLTSNYLLSTSKLKANTGLPSLTYRPIGQNGKILAHVRKSKFKLPITSSTPLILISAGTGFAPFRAFLQERAKLHMIGKPVGKILLFFGCRNQEDFIYREETEKIQHQLGDKFEMIIAFSREGSNEKVYVQERVAEHASKVLEMLEEGANMYICGKASIAKAVDAKLEDAASKARQLSEVEAKAWAEALKRRGKWRADVWG